MSNFKKRTTKKNIEEKKKLEEDYNLDMPVDDIAKDPNKFLQVLREKVSASNKSLNDIFKSFDVNNDGTISFDEFKNAMLATGIHFSELVLKQVFKRLDKNEGGTVSYMEFLSAIYSDKAEENIFDGLSKAEANFKRLQQIIQANFNSYEDMRKNLTLKQTDRMSEYEFKVFVQSITDIFSRLQLSDVRLYYYDLLIIFQGFCLSRS